MAPWYLVGVVLVAGIVISENRASWFGPAPSETVTGAVDRRAKAVEKTAGKAAEKTVGKTVEKAFVAPRPGERPAVEEKADLPAFGGKWFLCTTQTDYCVVDGGTLLYAGRKVRVADIDPPAIADARCDAERARGGDAKLRLREILNEGDFTLEAAPSQSTDGAGIARRMLVRDGKSLGQQLIQEGLARPWTGKHRSWCG